MSKRAAAVIASILTLMTAAWAQTPLVPTTTLAAETGNNTSAAGTFTTTTNGNLGATNISKLDVHTLLYAGAATKVYAHDMPWWGKTSHINVGYSSLDPAEVQRQVTDMASRGFDGAVVDWYGPDSYEAAGAKVVMNATLAQPNFSFIIEIEHGAVLWDSCYPTCDATTAFINLANSVAQTFYSSPAYVQIGGRPVLVEFNMAAFTIDWNQVAASVTGNPIIVHYNPPGLTTTATGGAFAWLDPKTLDQEPVGYDGSAYLNYFYQQAAKYPGEHVFGSIYKGFNDTLASWAPVGGRHIEQNCGQTWLKTFSVLNQYYSPSKPLESLQAVTWNDYEEGTAIESGIDNCVSVSASVSGSQLQWQITGDESTVDHYTVFLSSDGQGLMALGDVAAGTHAMDLSAFNFAAGAYSLFVKAIGKPSLANHMSAAAAYTIAPPVATPPPAPAPTPDLAVAATPGSVTLAHGQSSHMSVSVTPSGGFSGTVGLSCSGLPAGASCTFSPAAVAASSTAVSTTLTVSAPVMAVNRTPGMNWMVFAMAMPGAFGMVLFGDLRRKRALLLGVVLLLLIVSQVACGGAGTTTTAAAASGSGMRATAPIAPTGSYSFTITATSGSLTRSTTATLVIQ